MKAISHQFIKTPLAYRRPSVWLVQINSMNRFKNGFKCTFIGLFVVYLLMLDHSGPEQCVVFLGIFLVLLVAFTVYKKET